MITYAREAFDQVIDDIKVLLPQHWRELALYQDDIPLDADYDWYKKAFSLGLLAIYTVRLDDALIGYAIFVVAPRHPHYVHRWAKDDILWIAPEHRNMGVGNGLCEFFEKDLSRDGPIVIQVETKSGHPELNYLLSSRGYGVTGTVMGKRFA